MDRLTPMTLLVCPMSLLLWSKMKQPENSFTFNIFPAKFYQEMLLLLQSHQKTGTGNNLAMCAAFEKGGGRHRRGRPRGAEFIIWMECHSLEKSRLFGNPDSNSQRIFAVRVTASSSSFICSAVGSIYLFICLFNLSWVASLCKGISNPTICKVPSLPDAFNQDMPRCSLAIWGWGWLGRGVDRVRGKRERSGRKRRLFFCWPTESILTSGLPEKE